jgi:hypothetical protein
MQDKKEERPMVSLTTNQDIVQINKNNIAFHSNTASLINIDPMDEDASLQLEDFLNTVSNKEKLLSQTIVSKGKLQEPKQEFLSRLSNAGYEKPNEFSRRCFILTRQAKTYNRQSLLQK